MKRAVLYTLLSAASVAGAFAVSAPAGAPVVKVADDRIPCTTLEGRSGYLLSSGDTSVCVADDIS